MAIKTTYVFTEKFKIMDYSNFQCKNRVLMCCHILLRSKTLCFSENQYNWRILKTNYFSTSVECTLKHFVSSFFIIREAQVSQRYQMRLEVIFISENQVTGLRFEYIALQILVKNVIFTKCTVGCITNLRYCS